MKRAALIKSWLIACCWLLLGGCTGQRVQSILHPASDAAEEIARLWWVMLVICGMVFVFVVVVLALALIKKRQLRPQPPLGETRFVIYTGIIMPTVVLLGILFYSMQATVALRSDEASMTIEVIGHKWWWEVRYPDLGIVTANEIHIPVGEKVQLKLRSADVIHSFWVPELHGKTDMLPEITNTAWIAARRPGEYRGQCAEYCGLQHAHMAFLVVALPPDEFAAWARHHQRPASPPSNELAAAGQKAFFQAACDTCHAIDGTAADGMAGPDLTHFGSRRTIGAGAMANNRGNLAGWITDPQRLKPGNLMPRTFLTPNELHALLAYLEELQ